MRARSILRWRLLFVVLFVGASAGTACAQFPPPFDFSQIDQEMYEFIGQVKNSPATSVQYGHISHMRGLSDDQIYLGGVPQNEASALLTFYNDSVTEKVTNHGSLSCRLYAQSEKVPLGAERPSFRGRIYNEEGVPKGIPFNLLHGFLIVVEGRIGRLNHLKFILDTGVTRTVLNRKVADELHLPRYPMQVLNYNRSVAVEWATIPDLQFGPTHVTNVPILVADLPDFSELASDADTLIGFDLLGLGNFVIDYDTRRVLFRHLQRDASSPSTTPASDHLTELTVELRVQGYPVSLIVDTGLQGMVLFEDRLSRRIPQLKFEGGIETIMFGRHLHARSATLREVNLGSNDKNLRVFLLKGPPHDQVPGIDGYFGTALLNARWIEFNIADNNISYR